MRSELPLIVEMYAPWCGHCKALEPKFKEAAAALAGEPVRLAALDATQADKIAARFGVKGYPTLFTFPHGPKKGDKGGAKPYNGPREVDGLVAAGRALAEAAAAAGIAAAGGPSSSGPTQLTSPAAAAEACAGNVVCVVAVLPDILDEPAAKRSERLAVLGAAVAKSGAPRSLFRVLWAPSGAQPALERELGVGLVPSVFALAVEKRAVAAHVGAFTDAAIGAFLKGLAAGAANTRPLPPSFDLKAVLIEAAPWDGKDGVAAPSADEPSLADLDL